MAICAHCKTRATELYQSGVPICIRCADAQDGKKESATANSNGYVTPPPDDDREVESPKESCTQESRDLIARVRGLATADRILSQTSRELLARPRTKFRLMEEIQGIKALDDHIKEHGC